MRAKFLPMIVALCLVLTQSNIATAVEGSANPKSQSRFGWKKGVCVLGLFATAVWGLGELAKVENDSTACVLPSYEVDPVVDFAAQIDVPICDKNGLGCEMPGAERWFDELGDSGSGFGSGIWDGTAIDKGECMPAPFVESSNTRLAYPTKRGENSVLLVRVNIKQPTVLRGSEKLLKPKYATEKKFHTKLFGADSVKSVYEAASGGLMTFSEDRSVETTVTVSMDDTYSFCENIPSVESVLEALPSELDHSKFNFVSFALPDVGECGSVGRGAFEGRYSWLRDDSVGLIAHEFGHNLGWGHGDAISYADVQIANSDYSGIMGNTDARGVNLPHRDMQNWIADDQVFEFPEDADDIDMKISSLSIDAFDWDYPAGVKIIRGGEVLWLSYDHASVANAESGCTLEPRLFMHTIRGSNTVLLRHNTTEVIDEGLGFKVIMLEQTDAFAKIRLSNNATAVE